MNVVDFFCGCGGLSYGFIQAGFNVIVGIDTDEAALKTFERNHGNSCALKLDLSNSDFVDKLDAVLGDLSVDIIVGGPPCQGFSLTGTRNENDTRNELYKSMIVAIRKYRPKAFVIENVPGIKSLYKGQYYRQIVSDIESLEDYNFVSDIMFAPDFGVPQIRKRQIFIAIRKDVGDTTFPKKMIEDSSKYVTSEQAISDLENQPFNLSDEIIPYKTQSTSDLQDSLRRQSDGVANHVATKHSDLVISVIRQVPEGGNHKDLPQGVGESRKFNEAWTRYHSKKPSKTIDTGHRNQFHYKLDRVPTVRENARLQTFPDSFIFYGNKTQQYRQVGNAVPPMLGFHIANAIKTVLDRGTDEK